MKPDAKNTHTQIKSRINGELIGWENIELISDRPFETMVRNSEKERKKEREIGVVFLLA